MHELTSMIQKDMIPALGVTEPGAVAFCVASARSYTKGKLKHILVEMNSGMYKNAFTCGIPNSDRVGNVFAAAVGYIAGNADRGLESLADVRPEDNREAQKLIDEQKVTVHMSGISSRIFIRAAVETDLDTAIVTVRDSHTNITRIEVNGKVVFMAETEKADTEESADNCMEERAESAVKPAHAIHQYTLEDLFNYIHTVPADEISFVREAYRVNLELFEEGLHHPEMAFTKALLDMNGGLVYSGDEKNTASLLCNGAIEARVSGLNKPAVSIVGSGAHGIIATLPLYAVYRINGLDEEELYRATMLSYLICTYIKEYSGKLSAFCGCAIAAGTGMACGICCLKGGGLREIEYTLNNMASSVTGMICDGGNQGCTMKGVAACDTAFRSAEFAMKGVHIENVHGILGKTPEETMRNMGLIASPGMIQTEEAIVRILEKKGS